MMSLAQVFDMAFRLSPRAGEYVVPQTLALKRYIVAEHVYAITLDGVVEIRRGTADDLTRLALDLMGGARG